MAEQKTKTSWDASSALDQRRQESQSGSFGDSFIDNSKLQELGLKIFKMKEGLNSFIIIAPSMYRAAQAGEPLPYWGYILGVHYDMGVNKSAYACAVSMRKGKCPCCEEFMRAKDAGDEILQKKYRVNVRALYYAIDVTTNYQITRDNVVLWIGSEYAHDQELQKKCAKRIRKGDQWSVQKINPANPEHPYTFSFETMKKGNTRYSNFDLVEGEGFDLEQFLDLPDLSELVCYHAYDRMAETIRIGAASDNPGLMSDTQPTEEEENETLDRVKNAMKK